MSIERLVPLEDIPTERYLSELDRYARVAAEIERRMASSTGRRALTLRACLSVIEDVRVGRSVDPHRLAFVNLTLRDEWPMEQPS